MVESSHVRFLTLSATAVSGRPSFGRADGKGRKAAVTYFNMIGDPIIGFACGPQSCVSNAPKSP